MEVPKLASWPDQEWNNVMIWEKLFGETSCWSVSMFLIVFYFAFYAVNILNRHRYTKEIPLCPPVTTAEEMSLYSTNMERTNLSLAYLVSGCKHPCVSLSVSFIYLPTWKFAPILFHAVIAPSSDDEPLDMKLSPKDCESLSKNRRQTRKKWVRFCYENAPSFLPGQHITCLLV